jgi:MSHA biogenesis protein MshM|tara:strand:+ start:1221 stop:2132 length:912 start_codon:yes stop_codon:yes gene_type:complete
MYLQHFGLRELPFSLTPNTHFFLNMASYQKAYNMLMVSLANAEGFIKIVGEVGTGKTMLCRKVLNTLEEDKENYITAYIPNPVLSPKGLFLAFAEELSIEIDQDVGHHRLLKAITERLVEHSANNKQVVLFIDEAHAMPEQTLEALRLLTNIETEQVKLFQVVLFAQPELDFLLSQPSLRQLRQRITFSFEIEALDRDGVERYVVHRLATAGYNGPFLLSKRALDLLYKTSNGIPRIVNILCHKSLMVAFGKGERSVPVENIRNAAEDTEGVEMPSFNYMPAAAAVGGLVIGAGLLIFLGGLY